MDVNSHSPVFIESLNFKNLTVGHGDSSVSVEGVSCNLPMHEIVHIKGSRGVGKSTFMRILAGLSEPQSGEYLINNESVTDMSFEQFLKYRLQIGYGFEYGGLINNMTIYENMMLPLQYHNVLSFKQAHARVESYMRDFGLWQNKDKRPAFISGSMRKEVCVLRAFILEPQVLILDNPTTGISVQNVKKLKKLIWEKRELGEIKHVFIVSDDEFFLENLVTAEFVLDWKISEVDQIVA